MDLNRCTQCGIERCGPTENIDPKNIQLIKELGRGAFGCVFEAKWRASNLVPQIPWYPCSCINPQNDSTVAVGGSTVAVKYMEKHSNEDTCNFLREICALSSMKHTNIVELFGGGQTDSHYFLVMELAEGSLRNVLSKGPITSGKGLSYLRQSAEGLHFLHMNNMIHRDIKPENLLIFHKGETIKLGDFGLVSDNYLTRTAAGTDLYMDPQAIKTNKCNYKSDIYSWAVTIWEMFSGKSPTWNRQKRRPVIPKSWPKKVQVLILLCLSHDEDSIMSMDDVIKFYNYGPNENSENYSNVQTGSDLSKYFIGGGFAAGLVVAIIMAFHSLR
uniref:Mitogen-activated protein kinase kinase kinase 7 n=1 Tax=Culex pipiens TaxID=7175 RepID=A0A8D8B4W9_CULPI